MKAKYVNISVPDKLAKAIGDYIKEHPEVDLCSKAQVVNFYLRKLFVESNRDKVKVKE